jgi:hypothetical protein
MRRMPSLSTRLSRGLVALIVLGASWTGSLLTPEMAHASVPPHARDFAFDDKDCGPPSTTIPGPPPELIVVGQPMSDSWLMCYVKRDFEGQTFFFSRWGERYRTGFQGYPVECVNPEIDPASGGQQTSGIVAQVYGWNLDRTQYVRFTYRIQDDGDYINNCNQQILAAPNTDTDDVMGNEVEETAPKNTP